jgi:hypothetical protein
LTNAIANAAAYANRNHPTNTARVRLTGLSRTYSAQATTASSMTTIRRAAMPIRKSPSEAVILSTVAVASAGTTRL